MASWLTPRLFSTRESQLSSPGQTNFEALAHAIDLRRLNLIILLACLRLKLFIFGNGDPGLTLGGSGISPLYQTLAQQQVLASVYLSLEKIQIFQQACLDIVRSLGFDVGSSFQRPVYQLHQDSCRNKYVYTLVRLLHASGRLPSSHSPRRRLTPPSTGAGVANLDGFSDGRRPSRSIGSSKAVPDNNSTCSDACRDDSLSYAGLDPSSFGQRTIVNIEHTPDHSHLAERSLSQVQPQQIPPKQLGTPLGTPLTSAATYRESSRAAQIPGASLNETALAPPPLPDPNLIPIPCEVFNLNVKDRTTRDVQSGKHDLRVLRGQGTHLVPSIQSRASQAPPTPLKDGRSHSTQHGLPVVGCHKFVTATGGSQGKPREGSSPMKPTGGSDARGKRKTSTNSARRSTSDGVDDDQSDDGNGEKADPQATDNCPVKKLKALQFRCPKYAADPDSCNSKCEDWRSSEIASVTRHVKGDANSDPQKLEKIEILRHTKFPEGAARWRAYFLIFSDGEKTEQIDHPYWIKPCPSDPADQFLQVWMKKVSDGIVPQPHLLGYLQKVEHLRSLKVEREQQIDIDERRAIAAAQEKALKHRKETNAWFDQRMVTLRDGLARHEMPEEVSVEDRIATLGPSQEPQDSMLLQAGASSMKDTPPLQDVDELSDNAGLPAYPTAVNWRPMVVPPGDPTFVTNNMVRQADQPGYEGPQVPVDDYLERHVNLFNARELPHQPIASPMQQLQTRYLCPEYHPSYPQHSSSDPGYASASFRHSINDLQSSEISTNENFFGVTFDDEGPLSFPTQEMASQQYVAPASVEKQRPSRRRLN